MFPMVMLGVTDTELASLGLEQDIRAESYLTPKSDVDNAIVTILEDQHPHSVAEIASRINREAEKVGSFLQFLANYSFITYDEQNATAVICPDFAALS